VATLTSQASPPAAADENWEQQHDSGGGDADGEKLGVRDTAAVPLGERETLGETDGEKRSERDADGLRVTDAATLPLAVVDRDGDALTLGDGDADRDGDVDGVTAGVADGVSVGDTVRDGGEDGKPVSDALALAPVDSVAVAVAVCVGDGSGVGLEHWKLTLNVSGYTACTTPPWHGSGGGWLVYHVHCRDAPSPVVAKHTVCASAV
jgi:hypothetical protein